MNQKIVFYLISIIVVFFIGHYYSKFTIEPPEPVIISIDNSEEIQQYKSELSTIQQQLDDLDNQLINSLDELKTTRKKLTLSSSNVQVLKAELNLIQDKYLQLKSELAQSNSKIKAHDENIESLSNQLSSALIELELVQFELELENENL